MEVLLVVTVLLVGLGATWLLVTQLWKAVFLITTGWREDFDDHS